MLFDDGSVRVTVNDQQNKIVVKVYHDEFEMQYTYSKRREYHTIEEQRRQAILDATNHFKEAGDFIRNKLHKFSRGELSKDTIVF